MNTTNLSNWIVPELSAMSPGKHLMRFIIDKIRNQELQPGEEIPSCRTVAELNHINKKTVHKIYFSLSAQGWIVTKPGGKTYVAPFPPVRSDVAPSQEDLEELIFPIQQARRALAGNEKKVSYVSIGPPNVNQSDEFEDLIAKLILQQRRTRKGSTLIQKLVEVRGDDIRSAIFRYLHDVRKVRLNEDQLLLSYGHEDTLDLISKLIPDDASIVNAAGPGVYNQFNFERGRQKVYKLDASDKDFIERLEDFVVQHKVKLILIRPGCLFPAGLQMQPEICMALIKLAIRKRFFILEDDDEHEFRRTKQPFNLLWQYPHQGRVIYCGAFSRLNSYAQNIRTLIAADTIVRLLKELQELNISHRNLDKERAITALLNNGEFARHVRLLRGAKLADLLDMQRIFDRYLEGYIEYTLPESGLVVWIEFPSTINLRKVLRILEDKKVAVPYFPEQQKLTEQVRHLRLDISHYESEECSKAAIALKSILRSMLGF